MLTPKATTIKISLKYIGGNVIQKVRKRYDVWGMVEYAFNPSTLNTKVDLLYIEFQASQDT